MLKYPIFLFKYVLLPYWYILKMKLTNFHLLSLLLKSLGYSVFVYVWKITEFRLAVSLCFQHLCYLANNVSFTCQILNWPPQKHNRMTSLVKV